MAADDWGFVGTAADGPTQPGVNDIGVASAPSNTSPVLSPTSQQTFTGAMAYGLPSLGVGLLDTLGQSLHIIHNNTVPDILKSITGDSQGSMGDFYSHNQAQMRAGGEIAGMLLPGLVAMKALKSVNGLREAGSVGAWAKNSTALDWIMGSSADMAATEGKVVQGTKDALSEQGIWAGKTVSTPAVVAAKRGYYAKQALEAARATTAFELGNFAAFNSSQLFYPADTTVWDQAKWVGGGAAVGLGLQMAGARFAVRQMIQAASKSSVPAILGGGGNAAFVDVFSASPLAKDADKVLFRPNNRGVGITAYAGMNSDLQETLNHSNNPTTLRTNLYQDQVNIKKTLTEQIKSMAYDTHPFVPRTQLSEDQIKIGLEALNNNPTSFLFATKVGQLPEGGAKDFYEGVAKLHTKAVKDVQTSNILASLEPDFAKSSKILDDGQKAFAPIDTAANEMHYVIEPTGDWSVYKNRAPNWLDDNTFGSIKRKSYFEDDPANTGEKLKHTKLMAKGTSDLTLHDSMRIELPQAPTTKDFSALYAMGSKFIKDYEPVEGQTFILTPQVNWRTLEMQSALVKAKPEAMQAVKLDSKFASIDDVDFHILNEKFKEFNKLMPDTQAPAITKNSSLMDKLKSLSKNLTPQEVIQRLNLPPAEGFQTSPVTEMFAHAKLQGMKDLSEMFPKPKGADGFSEPYTQLDLVKQHLRETAGVADPKTQIPFQGKLLSQTNDTAPIFVTAKSTPHLSLADANIQSRVQTMRDVQLQKLSQIDPGVSPLLTSVIGKIVSSGREGGDLSGAANSARAVQTLQDGVLAGTGQTVYQDRINEQYPTLKALQLLGQDTDKLTSSYVSTLAAKSLTPKYAGILAAKNKNDLFDFNRIEQSYRHGWEIRGSAGGANAGTGGTHVFELEPDSRINAQLIQEHFPDVEPGTITHMPDMSVTALKNGYKPLEVSGASGDLAWAISDMSLQSGRENNALRAALGHNPIQLRDFHLPTPELNKEGTWFVRNPSGRVVSTYSGPNLRENEQRAKTAAETLGDQHVAIPLETVKRDHLVNDPNFISLIDYSDQLAKTGAGIKGGLAHTTIDTGPNTLKAMIRSLEEQFLNVGIRARAAVFEPELNYARQAADTAAASTRDNSGGFNIYDRYTATMFSQAPKAAPQNSRFFQKFYGAAEDGLDRSLSWLNQYYTDLTGTESNKIGAKILRTMVRQRSNDEEFAQFQKTLPKWSPFDDTEKWRESTFRETSKITSRGLSTDLAKVSSTMSLRFLDLGTAINNFAGLVTNAPSVVYGLRRGATENAEQWIARTGAWGTQYVDGTMTFSPMKAMNNSIKALWNGELNGPMGEASKLGYFDPEYSALAKALSAPASPSQKNLEKFVEVASKAADKSEMLSRQIAWGMGYKIGKDLHQFKDEKNAYIFANNFVNDMIGNYSPNNKPQMFQGAVGLPLGSFQTYMFNFYKRMYGNIERGDKAAVIAQYAAQASVFGAKSVPGFNAWNSFFQSNNATGDDFTGRVRRDFAPGVGELLLNGSLSNIPKIWGGLQGDGMAFYSRGSVDFTQPIPTFLDMSKAPPMQFLADVYKGTKETASNLASGFSIQQQEEILANMSTNRALKSIMELAADHKTSDRGEVIVAGTRNAFNTAAALLGTQPSSTRAAMEAYSRQRNVQLSQEDLRSTLTSHTRAILRGGDFTVEDLQGAVSGYMRSGGNPAYLGQWFRNTLMTSAEPRTQKQLNTLANSGKLLEFEDMLATLQQNTPSNAQGK